MEQRGKNTKKHEPSQHPFRQLLKCDHCGCSITSSISKGKYLYYHCGKRKGKCPGKYVSHKKIDKEIRSALQTVSLTPADAHRITQKLKELHIQDIQAGVNRTETLRTTLHELNTKLDTLLDMSLAGDITRDEYIQKKQSLLNKKTEIKETLRSVSDDGASWFEPARSILNQATAIPNTLQDTDPTTRAELFKNIGLNRVLHKDTIRFTPNGPWKTLYGALSQRGAPNSHPTNREGDQRLSLSANGRI